MVEIIHIYLNREKNRERLRLTCGFHGNDRNENSWDISGEKHEVVFWRNERKNSQCQRFLSHQKHVHQGER